MSRRPWWGGVPTLDIAPLLRQPTNRKLEKRTLIAASAGSIDFPRPTSADRCFIYSITVRSDTQNPFGVIQPYLYHNSDETYISFGQARPNSLLRGYTWRPPRPQFWSKEAKNLIIRFTTNQANQKWFICVEWAEN